VEKHKSAKGVKVQMMPGGRADPFPALTERVVGVK
jgi:hypothetical protein